MIRGRIFREMIRVSAQKSQLQAKVGVTDQKSELQPGRPPESEPNRPEKGPEWRLGASTENPRKAFLNPDKIDHMSDLLWMSKFRTENKLTASASE